MKAGGLPRGNSPATRGVAGGWLSNIRAALLSVVFPAGCRICEQLFTEPTRIPICNDCLGSFRRRSVERIAISAAATFIFSRCVNEDWDGYAFDRGRSWAVYDGALFKRM
jgi:hypothetical protein